MPDEVLTTKDVAALLKLADATVFSITQAGDSPAFETRGQWRVKHPELNQAMDAQPCRDSSGDDDDGR